MFTFRLRSYQIIQYLLIIFVSSGVIAKQASLKCAAHGEYCLNHWDCCSNACLSYLYRCARGHGVYPYPFLGVSYKPTVSLEQILDQNFGSSNALPDYQEHNKPYFGSRFGEDANPAATETKNILLKPEQTAGESTTSKNALDLKETSVSLEASLDSTTLDNSIDIKTHGDSSTSQSCSEQEETLTTTENYLYEDKTEVQTDAVMETTQETVKTPSYKPTCAKIGEKCYQNDDCCDKLCHGYLHQCVT